MENENTQKQEVKPPLPNDLLQRMADLRREIEEEITEIRALLAQATSRANTTAINGRQDAGGTTANEGWQDAGATGQ